MNKSIARFSASLLAGVLSFAGGACGGQPYDINKDINFVHHAYQDLLGVDISYDFSYALAGLMETSHISRTGIASMITGTSQYRKRMVDNLYQSYLNRPATAFDENYWVSGTGASQSLRFLRAAILGTDEFTHTYFRDYYRTPAEDFAVHLMLQATTYDYDSGLQAIIVGNLNGAPANNYTHLKAASVALSSASGMQNFCQAEQYSLKLTDTDGSLQKSCYLTLLYGGTEQDAVNLFIASNEYYTQQ